MIKKLLDLGIDPASIKPNSTTSTKSKHGTVWVKNYSITLKEFTFNVLIIGSYSGLEMGEDGQRVLTLWEPVGELPDGVIDPLDIVKEIEKAVKEEDAKQKHEKILLNEQVQREAHKFIEQLRSSGFVNAVESPYLKRKGIATTPKGVYVDQSGTLIIPMTAERGQIWNYQRVTPEGNKYFLAGGRISGCYHIVSHGTSNTIFIGEGYVTCASVAESFRDQGKRPTVVCAFNSGNMPHVCRAIRKLYPNKKIIILADNDQWKEKNTGILTAQKCGEAFVTPQFDLDDPKVQELKPTDFNDLHNLMSLGEVYRQVTGGIEALAIAAKKREEVSAQSDEETEISVARRLLTHFGDTILAHNEDLFLWDQDQGFWRHLEKGNFQRIMQIIVRMFGDKATDKKVRGAFNLFKISVGQVDASIFVQKKHLCNFKNGTLVFDNGKVWLKPHDKKDLLTYSLPLLCPLNVANGPVDGSFLPPPGLFYDLLQRITGGDPDKILLIRQMYGTALFPLYPQIFFLHGQPKTGKSQIAKVAIKLVGDENCSSVSPTNLFGFNLHDTVGKRVNYDIDVTTRRPLTDDILKKVIDQMPIQITRKNRDSLRATLPPVHIYVGNDLPSLNEGSAKPFERRLSLMKVTAKPIEASEDNKRLAEDIIEKECEHVIHFAISGILSLWESKGEFVQAADKKNALAEWELASSPEKDFVELLKTDGVPVYDEDGKFTGERLFMGEGYTPRTIVTNAARKMFGNALRKHLLFKEIQESGAMVGPMRGSQVFKGIVCRRDIEDI